MPTNTPSDLEVGVRIRLSEVGKRTAKAPDRRGVVVGHGRSRTQIRVLWDGLKGIYTFHRMLLERDTDHHLGLHEPGEIVCRARVC